MWQLGISQNRASLTSWKDEKQFQVLSFQHSLDAYKVSHLLVLRLPDKIFNVNLKHCTVLAYHQYNTSGPNGTRADAFTKNTERHWQIKKGRES